MKPKGVQHSIMVFTLALAILLPQVASGQGESKRYSQPQIDQLLAPVALYPDPLLTQILMASTYPLEVVQADRWEKKNRSLKGDALTAALEKQTWDPSVKSLVNFPDVLSMMSEKLDWTEQLGDAFLAQEKDVMDGVQKLRAKAKAEGNLKSTREQKVVAEQETIIIQPASPEVVYVPAYNPSVVYGVWAYPAYPPYPVYPAGYVAAASAFSFTAGVAVGAAWGYAWGHPDWHGGDVNINNSQNINVNNNINRNKYKNENGQWQHNPEHRKGVPYRDNATAQKYNRGGSAEAARSREAFRGRGGAGQPRGGRDAGRGGAFEGIGRGGDVRSASDRGRSSRQSMSPSRGGGGLGGGRGMGGGRGRR